MRDKATELTCEYVLVNTTQVSLCREGLALFSRAAPQGKLVRSTSTRRDAIRQSSASFFITNSTGTLRTKIVEPYCVFTALTNATSGVTNRTDWITMRGVVHEP